jgi:hypothetical protein
MRESEAINAVEPYMAFAVFEGERGGVVPREAGLRVIALGDSGPGEPGTHSLEEVANTYQRAFFGRVVETTAGRRSATPTSFHRIEVERWVFNPPAEDRPAVTMLQRGAYLANWAIVAPGDPVMLPGQRFLFFGTPGLQQSAWAVSRFPIVDGVLTASHPYWAELAITKRLAGLTEDEAVAEIQRCLEVVPATRAGRKAEVRDRCVG